MMSSPSQKKEKKMRKKNFTQQEIFVLCEFVKNHRDKLFGRAGHCAQKVEDRKRKYWMQAALSVRAAGGADREWSELKKKWSDLKTLANKYKGHMLTTGGGPSVEYNPSYEAVLEAMAPQARDGVTALGETETDPLTTAIMDIEEPSHSSQGTSSPEPCTGTGVSQLNPHTTTPPPTKSSSFQQTAPTPPQYVLAPGCSFSFPERSSSPQAAEIKQSLFQEEILQMERAKLEISSNSLKVQKGILSALESIAASLLQKKNEA